MLTIQKVIRDTAVQAGVAAAKWQEGAKIVTQRLQDFVTEADLISEQIILEQLEKYFPGVPFLSEEAGGEELRKGQLFVVDPIDGTVNFFHQDIYWGVSIALVEDGRAVAGAICLPQLDVVLSADTKGPARLRRISTGAERELHVSSQRKIIESRVWFDVNIKIIGDQRAATTYLNLYKNTTQPVTHGCAVAGPSAVAQGWCDAYYHSSPKPFDTAAGGLIVRQAGGEVTDIDGNEWNAFSGSFVASNGHIHEELLELLN